MARTPTGSYAFSDLRFVKGELEVDLVIACRECYQRWAAVGKAEGMMAARVGVRSGGCV